MSEFNSEKSSPCDMYTSSDPSSSKAAGVDKEVSWRSLGTSMDAISLGFVATAILISMFLIMAIFEHLFKPTPQFSSQSVLLNNTGSHWIAKQRNQHRVPSSYASEFSVLMPGQLYPTYLAQPAPLPCQREGIYWPSHQQKLLH